MVILVLSGCTISKSLYKAEDKRAIAYYQAHASNSTAFTETEKLSDTDVILTGLQACKTLQRYPNPERALAHFGSRYYKYTSHHRRVIFASGVHGYCPEHEDKLRQIAIE